MNTTSQATTSEALLYIDQAEMSAEIPQLESKPFCTAYVVLCCTEVKHYWKCTLKETVSFVKKMLLQLLLARLKHTHVTYSYERWQECGYHMRPTLNQLKTLHN